MKNSLIRSGPTGIFMAVQGANHKRTSLSISNNYERIDLRLGGGIGAHYSKYRFGLRIRQPGYEDEVAIGADLLLVAAFVHPGCIACREMLGGALGMAEQEWFGGWGPLGAALSWQRLWSSFTLS
ncbi:hypothetical protein WN55_09845 [Dufourea novaeangliae]|uniref:Uncharacterized protein n=1 Tax=Dufourea novaeangliae TaxID=178035 RepID=A0A154P7F6_DUFNO|nr:hypothetical protein WN55_09845 [Dufourea novaeangliae]